jgi:hypothetical protein
VTEEYLIKKNERRYEINVEIESKEKKIKELEAKLKNKEELSNEDSNKNEREKEALQIELAETKKNLGQIKEKAAREKTEDDIKSAITSLSSPDVYINKEVKYHRALFVIYSILTVVIIVAGIYYEICNYKTTIDAVTKNTNTLILIVNIAPILLLLSLFGTFVSLLNKSLKNIERLKERERSVKRIGGTLQAISELSQNNTERVERINIVLDNMAKNLATNNHEPEHHIPEEKDEGEVNRLWDFIDKLGLKGLLEKK